MRQRKKKQRRRRAIDSSKEEETAQRVAAVEARRQRIINDVKLSLKRRQLDRIAIENARFDTKASIRRREIRDAKEVHGEKAMLQVRLAR